ncbi:MAG: ECF transporter S component [Firmicutes bacterium]|nr:ECF transporter S component [Bacillota bacterium]
MNKNLKKVFNRIVQILIVALLSFCIDNLIIILTHDDSIWLGEAIEAVGAVIFGPLVGGVATLISCIATDYLTYGNFDYAFISIFEALSMTMIGAIYRRLVKDEDKFGVKEIVIFNFVQVLINTMVLYLATPPAVVMFFEPMLRNWTKEDFAIEMKALCDDAFSACISVALIGTVLLAFCIAFRKRYKEKGSVSDTIKSFFKQDFIKKEYRSRAFEYSIGFVFATALTMVDGVISGHTLGQDALAATSVMFPLISLTTFLSNLFTSGCSNLCAREKGRGNYERARKLFSMGFLTTISLGVLQTVFLFIIKDFYFEYYKTTEQIAAYALEYYKYYILVPPFMAIALFLDEIASSDGDDMLSYAGYITSFVVNIGASVILSKRMGMGGLALGTMLSYVCYMLVVGIHFFKKSNTYKFQFWYSFKELFNFAKHSLKTNTSGLCMSLVSAAFTKAILIFWGSDYLIANTVLCAMLEIYEIINGPSEAAEYLFATYSGEKNKEGIKTLFKEVLSACLLVSMAVSLILLLKPDVVLLLYGIESSPHSVLLIKCIRYCAVGLVAAAVGGFLSDYYGNMGKPFWSCLMVVFRTALFPILFCVTFCYDGGIVAMGKGMLLAQITAVAVFYGFVLIINGAGSIPFMFDDSDFEKVMMNSFEYTPDEIERIGAWINEELKKAGIGDGELADVKELVFSILKKTSEKNVKKKVLGECVIRLIDSPEIIIKDNGELFKPDIEDDRYCYNILYSSNSNKIQLKDTAEEEVVL